MDESNRSITDPKDAHELATDMLAAKIDEWKQSIDAMLKIRFDITQKFINRTVQTLQKQVGSSVLEMPVGDFIAEYINPPPVTGDRRANFGNQTLAALDNIDYFMNSSHHDDEVKKAAAKLQERILSKK